MSLQDQDDLMPRPLPKPSQVEIISVRPEVPEPSLIIDKSYSHTKLANGCMLNSFKQSDITGSPPSRNFTDQNFDGLLHRQQKCSELLTSTSPYSLPGFPHQVNSHSNFRKVSFSPVSSDLEQTKSTNLIHNPHDYRKKSFKPESCSCHCNDHEAEPSLRKDGKLHSTSLCTDFSKKCHRIPVDYEYSIQNEACSRKPCSCAGCVKEYFGSLPSKEQKQNFISVEDLQKTVLKFENLFLKLNYKYSKITENFVSKEELSSVVRNYEAKINSMQIVIDSIASKSNANRCNHCNQASPKYKPAEPVMNLVTAESTSSVHAEEPKLCLDNYNRIIISESKPFPSNDALNGMNNRCDRKQDDCQQPFYESQKFYANALEDQAKQSLTPNDRFWNSGRIRYNEELFENKDQISLEGKTKNPSNPRNHLNIIAAEKKIVESNGNQEHEKVQIAGNLNDNQQLKLLYNNIIMQVKNMLEKNIAVDVHGKTDPMQFIKEATIEQFKKMGLNVKNIVDENAEGSFQRRQLHDGEEPKIIPAAKTNIPSSDLSLHMNALAMKYISNYQKDENDLIEKSTMNDVSVNCNNVSIATLRYLERHQILSELDKPLGYTKENAKQRFKTQDSDYNDRSFIR